MLEVLGVLHFWNRTGKIDPNKLHTWMCGRGLKSIRSDSQSNKLNLRKHKVVEIGVLLVNDSIAAVTKKV